VIDPTQAEYDALTNEIVRLNNTRVFDSRISRKYQLNALDSLLKAQKLIGNAPNFANYTQLQDAFLYANYFQRNTGNRFEIALTNNTLFEQNNTKTTTSELNKLRLPAVVNEINTFKNIRQIAFFTSIGLKANYTSSKQINYKKDRYFYTIVDFYKQPNIYITQTKNTDTTLNVESSSIYIKTGLNCNIGYGRGYYFNTRNYFTWNTGAGISHEKYGERTNEFNKQQSTGNPYDYTLINGAINTSFVHFFNYRTTITANANLNYREQVFLDNRKKEPSMFSSPNGFRFEANVGFRLYFY
jgi:hypothetical protein